MRNLRTLLIAVVLAMAFSGSSASAALEILEEGGTHCPAVSLTGTDVNGGCLTHITSNGVLEIRKHVFGIETHITKCNTEFAGRVEEGGVGYLFEQVLSGAGCSRQACASDNSEGEKNPWIFEDAEDSPGGSRVEGREYLTTLFCIEPREGGTDEQCEIDIPFQSYPGPPNHVQEYGHIAEVPSHTTSPFRCELLGHLVGENSSTHDGQAEHELHIFHIP